MNEYHKIQSVYKRDEKTKKFIIGDWSLPELGYLKDLTWTWDEKIDGTNIRIHWDGTTRTFGGRTDNALIPATLIKRLEVLFTPEKLKEAFGETIVTLYGEGFGAKIQSGGDYLPDQDFILFDVYIGNWWLERHSVAEISDKLGLRLTAIRGEGTLEHAIEFVKAGFKSVIGTKYARRFGLSPESSTVQPKGRTHRCQSEDAGFPLTPLHRETRRH